VKSTWRRVDDIDLHVPPGGGGGGGSNGDAAFLLLFHPVHGGRAFMDFADLVRAPCVYRMRSVSSFYRHRYERRYRYSHPLQRYSAWHFKALEIDSLPAVVRERFVGFRIRCTSSRFLMAHPANWLRRSVRWPVIGHAFFGPPARIAQNPANGETGAPRLRHFDRHLIVGAATRRVFTSSSGLAFSTAFLNNLMALRPARSSSFFIEE